MGAALHPRAVESTNQCTKSTPARCPDASGPILQVKLRHRGADHCGVCVCVCCYPKRSQISRRKSGAALLHACPADVRFAPRSAGAASQTTTGKGPTKLRCLRFKGRLWDGPEAVNTRARRSCVCDVKYLVPRGKKKKGGRRPPGEPDP